MCIYIYIYIYIYKFNMSRKLSLKIKPDFNCRNCGYAQYSYRYRIQLMHA